MDIARIRTEVVGDVELATDFWDCECEYDYIRSYATDDHCELCGAESDSSPNSRASEVRSAILALELAAERAAYENELEARQEHE